MGKMTFDLFFIWFSYSQRCLASTVVPHRNDAKTYRIPLLKSCVSTCIPGKRLSNNSSACHCVCSSNGISYHYYSMSAFAYRHIFPLPTDSLCPVVGELKHRNFLTGFQRTQIRSFVFIMKPNTLIHTSVFGKETLFLQRD